MSRYAVMFARLQKQRAGAFIPFVVLGDPTPDDTLDILDALIDGGADALELGIPFSDPIADGPTIQAAGVRALAAGTTPSRAFQLCARFRDRHNHPLGLLVYANLVEARGRAAFYAEARRSGVDSVLVADVPALEAPPFAAEAKRHDVEHVMIAAPNASPVSLLAIARLSQGYTYVVSRAGVTGSDVEAGLDHEGLLRRLVALGAPPGVLGFGISTPEHVRAALSGGAAGAISGSAVVQIIERHLDDPAARATALTAFTRRMKAATLSG